MLRKHYYYFYSLQRNTFTLQRNIYYILDFYRIQYLAKACKLPIFMGSICDIILFHQYIVKDSNWSMRP